MKSPEHSECRAAVSELAVDSTALKSGITVAIPVYNCADYVVDTLDRLLEGQTDKDFRVLIGDDASSDQTASVCRSYAEKHPNVTVMSHAKNLGPEKNKRSLADAVDTEIFVRMDDDDELEPNYIGTMRELLEANSLIECVVPQMKKIYSNKSRIVTPTLATGNRAADLVAGMTNSMHAINVAVMRTAYARKAYAASARYLPAQWPCSDALISLYILLDGRYAVTRKTSYLYVERRPTKIIRADNRRAAYSSLQERIAAARLLRRYGIDMLAAVRSMISEAEIGDELRVLAMRHHRTFVRKNPLPLGVRLYKKMAMLIVLGRYSWFMRSDD